MNTAVFWKRESQPLSKYFTRPLYIPKRFSLMHRRSTDQSTAVLHTAAKQLTVDTWRLLTRNIIDFLGQVSRFPHKNAYCCETLICLKTLFRLVSVLLRLFGQIQQSLTLPSFCQCSLSLQSISEWEAANRQMMHEALTNQWFICTLRERHSLDFFCVNYVTHYSVN